MQLDGALITIERRTTSACIDLAVVFVRQHLAGVLSLTLLFAIPSCLLSYWAVANTQATLVWMLLWFLLVSPFHGAALVIAAGRRVFGEELSVRAAMQTLRTRVWRYSAYVLLVRGAMLLTACLLLPPLLIGVRYGFVAEVLFLERAPSRLVRHRLRRLLDGVYPELVFRSSAMLCFFVALFFGYFVLAEFLATTIFGLPIVSGRLSTIGMESEFTLLLMTDPRVVTVIQGLLWLVYPLVRLAWFFCYLDVRIEKEGWDTELNFRIESQRLGSGGTAS